ncbi:heme exporter protein CcmD [Thiocystis violacea]|uniref:heme exporter protein CcmD n=1 Tax=Thiocystis violacea TaxID=13725 RepID=UPI001906AC32|nr:heme exporter protein CcmD [Thiocystis violacea]MBK1719344.1 heme exporter protein CcmD [Thiocystis violacea]
MSDFFSQGGYAFFVWGAYGMVVVLLLIEILQLRSQRRTILARLGRLTRMPGTRTSDFGATE